MRDIKSTLISIFAGLISSILIKEYGDLQVFSAFILFIIITTVLYYSLVFLNRNLSDKYRYIKSVIDKYHITPSSQAMFYMSDKEDEFLSNRIGNKFFTPTTVFMQIRLKSFINWVDVVYFLLIRDLSNCGIKTAILIHDYDYYEEDRHGTILPKRKADYARTLSTFIDAINSITQKKSKILVASKYFKKRTNASVFVDGFYMRFIPTFIEHNNNGSPNSRVLSIDFLRFILGLFAIDILSLKGHVVSLIWEGRRDWVDSWGEINRDAYHTYIYGSTIKNESGMPVLVDKREDSICLDDTKEVIEKKVPSLSKSEKEYIWYLVIKNMLSEKELKTICGVRPDLISNKVIIESLLLIQEKYNANW